MTWRTGFVLIAWPLLAPARWWWRVPVCLVVFVPLVAVVWVTVVIVAVRIRSLRRTRRIRETARAETILLGELVALSLSAGSGFAAALEEAAPELSDPLRSEVAQVVRRMRHEGAERALATGQGHGRRLYALAARSLTTGAPLLDTVERFVDDARVAERERRLATVRRLPVLMMFPLALLVLPGFVLVTVAPGVVAAIERLGA